MHLSITITALAKIENRKAGDYVWYSLFLPGSQYSVSKHFYELNVPMQTFSVHKLTKYEYFPG